MKKVIDVITESISLRNPGWSVRKIVHTLSDGSKAYDVEMDEAITCDSEETADRIMAFIRQLKKENRI